MADARIFIKIYDNDFVEILDGKQNVLQPTLGDVNIKGGKKVGQAFWWNENPTCVWYDGKKY